MRDTCVVPHTTAAARWSLGGFLLEAIAERDFEKLAEQLDASATMRALLPSGPAAYESPEAMIGAFRKWFGAATEFEVVDGTVGEVGGRIHVSWRIRQRPTPAGDDSWHVVEQQAYLRTGERIASIDLLCSGFQRDESGR